MRPKVATQARPRLVKAPGGPVAGTMMSAEYAYAVGKIAYIWAWPMINIHNRLLASHEFPQPGLSGGVVPVAPPNQLSMLQDYIKAEERFVACPNQDVVYGFAMLSLVKEPIVIQVPDFGDRFWIYQVGDQRTDAIGGLGSMYQSRPGFYLLVGPDWQEGTPSGFIDTFHSSTQLAYIIPRIFMHDTDEDRLAIRPLVNNVMLYPFSRFDGRMKTTDWSALPSFPAAEANEGEIEWVKPEQFFDTLPKILREVAPLPGEEALYTWFESICVAGSKNTRIKDAIQRAAVDSEKECIQPLLLFHNTGVEVDHGWHTPQNGAQFGVDYLSRVAMARANIFVNQPQETAYFYQEFAADKQRLHGKKKYTLTFPEDSIPPALGFWSLTLYDEHHFFAPNRLHRYSLGSKNTDLSYNADGSLTIFIQSEPPALELQSNWLPAPDAEFELYLRIYWPKKRVLEGNWSPPPVRL